MAETNQHTIDLLLHLADNALILAQRNGEWCGHGPILEQDIAITNITLDLIGQSRLFYQYAATLIGNGATEDSLAFLRTEKEYKNLLLVECPNGNWAQTIGKQFLFSTYQQLLFTELLLAGDAELAAITEKSLKEIKYHVRWSSEWVIRLGDGTAESKEKMQCAINELWAYTGEIFTPTAYENSLELNWNSLHTQWEKNCQAIFEKATLDTGILNQNIFMHQGGKTGIHSKEMGPLLADLQYMQRTFPNCEW
jgi:ring-1,2-phenylacetyl-CoA epoxidase subunit PaaC